MVVCSRGPAARPESARGRLQGRNHRVYQRVSALLLPCPRLLPWGRVRGIRPPLLVRDPGQSARPRARLLGLCPVLQRLQTRHVLSQGPGKLAVCTKCPNMPVAGRWHPAWPTRSHSAGPRRGQRTNGDESRLCRGPDQVAPLAGQGIDPGRTPSPRNCRTGAVRCDRGRRRRPAMLANAAKQWEVELVSREWRR